MVFFGTQKHIYLLLHRIDAGHDDMMFCSGVRCLNIFLLRLCVRYSSPNNKVRKKLYA